MLGCAIANIVGKLVGLFSLSPFGFIVLFTFRSVWLLLMLFEHLKSWFVFSETVSSIVEMTLLISCNNDSCNLTSFRKFTVAVAVQSEVHAERQTERERKKNELLDPHHHCHRLNVLECAHPYARSLIRSHRQHFNIKAIAPTDFKFHIKICMTVNLLLNYLNRMRSRRRTRFSSGTAVTTSSSSFCSVLHSLQTE